MVMETLGWCHFTIPYYSKRARIMFKVGDMVQYKSSSNIYYAIVLSIDSINYDTVSILWLHNGKETPFYMIDVLKKVEHA